MKEVNKAIDKVLIKGIKMSKQISSGGIFTSPTYDRRQCHTIDEMYKLFDEGFTISEGTIGIAAFNILIELQD